MANYLNEDLVERAKQFAIRSHPRWMSERDPLLLHVGVLAEAGGERDAPWERDMSATFKNGLEGTLHTAKIAQ